MSGPDILITDYYCASNRGDAAILAGVIDGLQAEYPRAEFTVATEFPEAAEAINGVDAIKQQTVPWKPYHVQKNRLLGAVTANALASGLPGVPMSSQLASTLNLEPYLEADLIVATGGQYLTDNYMPSKIGALWELWLCKRLMTPVVLYAHSIGPLEKEPYASIARRVLDRVDLITLRDKRSKQVLEDLGVSETPLHVTADAAFAMDLNNREKTPLQHRRIESPPTFEASDPVVSISARQWGYFGSGNQEQYEEAVAEFADWLLEEHGANIVFLSTCTGFDGYHTDDRATAHSIIEQMNQATAANPQVVTGEYTPQELSRLYGDVDLHVGTRMHSNILALLQGTPIVAIEYEFKTSELMRQFELGEYVVDIDSITAPVLTRTASLLMDNSDAVQERIERNLEPIRENSLRTAALISDHIDIGR